MSSKLVVKIGTAVLSRPEGGLDRERVNLLAEEVAAVQKRGRRVVLVSSGAIGAGMDRFGWKKRPTVLRDKQAAAAVGQVVLMEAYGKAFSAVGLTVAQMLLTASDLEDRGRYLNARNTLQALLERGVVPVINENDTVATEEIQFGDNDSLAARVAVKIGAEKLFLLTDVEGLLRNLGPGAELLPEVFQITPEVEALVRAERGSHKSAGGMASKLRAARTAMAAGVEVWIASGRRPGAVSDILEGRGAGTRFAPARGGLDARRRWLAFGRRVKGTLVLDDGAVAALVRDRRSLLPAGVLRAEGEFSAGDTVRLLSSSGAEVARGTSSFGAADLRKILGKKSAEVSALLGARAPAEAVHRNNLVVYPASPDTIRER